jgi:hypothetical protein
MTSRSPLFVAAFQPVQFAASVDIPPPTPDVVPLPPSPHPLPPSPSPAPVPPEIIEPPNPGQHEPVREPILPTPGPSLPGNGQPN